MKKIYQVSYPRSGTQLLQFILFTYFSGNLYFPFTSKEQKNVLMNKFINDNPINNENYLSFEQMLKFFHEGESIYKVGDYKLAHISNANDECNYIHWHGEDGELKNDGVYIIQYRHPVYAILSMMNYNLRDEDIPYAKEMVIKWRNFINKWVLNNSKRNCYIVRYLDLISEPKKHLLGILKLAECEINEPFLEAAINVHKIKPYYKDKKVFNKSEKQRLSFIEEECLEEMRLLKIERILQ